MERTDTGKIKRLAEAYFTGVPVWANALSNFIAGMVCRMLAGVLFMPGAGAAGGVFFVGAVIFTLSALNLTAYNICSAVPHQKDRKPHIFTGLAAAAAAAALGAATGPYFMNMIFRT